MDFWVCTYNTMLMLPPPIRFHGQHARARRIPKALLTALPDLDVVVFQELGSLGARKTVLDGMAKQGWTYATDRLMSPFLSTRHPKIVCGGVVIVSKHPILHQAQKTFDNCALSDCWASKGVVYARIQKGRHVFNVVGTHLQAWDECATVRADQLQQCRRLVAQLNLPRHEPVVFAGDFNEPVSVDGFRTIDLADDSEQFSFDPDHNTMVGNDSPSMYVTADHPRGCYSDYKSTWKCVCCPQQLLDYVHYATDHAVPTTASARVVHLKSAPFVASYSAFASRAYTDLSDHFPVVAHLQFDDLRDAEGYVPSDLPPHTIDSVKATITIVMLVLFLILCAARLVK